MGLCFSHIFNQGGCSFSRIIHQWFNLTIVEGFCSSRISSSRVRSRPILVTCFSDVSNFSTGRDGVWFLVFRGWWSWPELSPSMFLLSSLLLMFCKVCKLSVEHFHPHKQCQLLMPSFWQENLFEGEKNMVCKIENMQTGVVLATHTPMLMSKSESVKAKEFESMTQVTWYEVKMMYLWTNLTRLFPRVRSHLKIIRWPWGQWAFWASCLARVNLNLGRNWASSVGQWRSTSALAKADNTGLGQGLSKPLYLKSFGF